VSPSRFVLWALALVFTLSSGLTASSAALSAHEPTFKHGLTLRVWSPFPLRGPEQATLRRVVRGWEGLTGNRVILGGHASVNGLKMCDTAPEGHGPDLVGVGHDQLSQLIACRAIEPIPAHSWPVEQRRAYIAAAVQAVRIDGRQWAMPWSVETYGLFYNTAMIPVGLFTPHPLRWVGVLNEAKKLTHLKTRKYGLVWGVSNFYLDYGFVSASGGYVFKITDRGFDRHNLGVSSAGGIAGLRFVQNLTTAGSDKLIPSSMTASSARDLFARGDAAMVITGPWDEDTFREHRIAFGVVSLPAIGTEPAHPFALVRVFAVNRLTRHPREALSLVQYMTTHMQLPEFTASSQLPVVQRYLLSRVVQGSPVARGLADAALSSQAIPNIPEMAQVWRPMNVAMGQIARGRSVEDATRSAVDAIRAAIAKTGSRLLR
jgi:arabinogalactan oligomer/maltooligosaccharide transport system substrate-binding protein